MKIQNNSIYVGDDIQSARHGENQKPNSKHGKTIDGKGLQAKLDPIAAKKEEAKKKAMKIVGDAFANERKLDDELGGRRQRIRDLSVENGEANREIEEYENMRLDLREQYGVDRNSQEEKDLRLLEKEMDSHRPDSQITLTEDDYKELERIKKTGLSDYQERSMEIRGYEGPAKDTIYQNNLEIRTENAVITATEIERLKTHPMVDAQKQADAIMDETSKEIVGMLVDEAKEHIDEEADKEKEKAEAEKEKVEELQERIDAAKEKKKENEELTEDILEGVADATQTSTDVNAAQQQVKDMMNKMKLIEDDIKGAAVDKSL